MDNPSTSSDRFNSSNLSMPPSRLIYSSNHFVYSLNKWLRTNQRQQECSYGEKLMKVSLSQTISIFGVLFSTYMTTKMLKRMKADKL